MLFWILQTGEPMHTDISNARPMRAMNLSNYLISRGHKVHIFTSNFYHQEKKHRFNGLFSKKVSDKLKITFINSIGYKKNIGLMRIIDHMQLGLNLKNELKKTDEVPDIIFIGYPPIDAAYEMVRFGKNKNIPMVLDVKDQWPDLLIEKLPSKFHFLGRLLFFHYFYESKKIFDHIDGFSVTSNSFKEWAQAKISNDGIIKKFNVSPLAGPDVSLSASDIEQCKDFWKKNKINLNHNNRIFFAGTLSQAFDFDFLVSIALELRQKIQNFEFVVCGHGPRFKEVKNLMKDLSNVKVIGWVEYSKILYLSKFSIGTIAPYKNTQNFLDNIPNKIIDSLSFGLPIITMLEGETKLLINKYSIGISDNNVNTIVKYISNLSNNPIGFESLSAEITELHRKKFSYKSVHQKLEKFLLNVIDEKK